MAEISKMVCCGLKEIRGLSSSSHKTAYSAMLDVAASLHNAAAMAVFTGVIQDGAWKNHYYYGQKFAEYIVKNGLGDVIQSPVARNPNSGNNISAWIWVIDHQALGTWIKDHVRKG